MATSGEAVATSANEPGLTLALDKMSRAISEAERRALAAPSTPSPCACGSWLHQSWCPTGRANLDSYGGVRDIASVEWCAGFFDRCVTVANPFAEPDVRTRLAIMFNMPLVEAADA